MEKTMRQRILAMKEIKEKHGLKIPQIMNLVADNGGYVSERTLQSIFKEGSENKKFQYHSIADVYEGLVAVYGEDYATEDVATLKHIIGERNKKIDSLLIQFEDQESGFKRRLEFFDERKASYENTIAILKSQVEHLKKQLEFHQESMARKDEILMKMLDSYVINDKMEG